MDFEEYIEDIRRYKDSYESARGEAIRDIEDLGVNNAMEKFYSNPERGQVSADLFKFYRYLGYVNAFQRALHQQT